MGYGTLYLALLLSFHHSLTPQTFIEHLWVPGSALGTGDSEDSGLCLPGTCCSLAFSSRAGMMEMISLSRCAAWYCTSALVSLFFLPLIIWCAPFLSSKSKSDLSLRGDVSIFDNNHSTPSHCGSFFMSLAIEDLFW